MSMRPLLVLLGLGYALAAPLQGFPLKAIHPPKALAGQNAEAAPATSSQKLYFFNGSHQVPGTNELLEYDVAAKTYTSVSKNNYGQNSCLSASVVCDDTYYAVWTFFPAAAGVLAVDLKTGATNYLGTGGQGYIYHALRCDKKNTSSLLGFASKMNAGPKGSLQFQLVSFDTKSGDTTMIGALPEVVFAGYDGTFQFSPDGTELYAAFAGTLPPKEATGNLYIMDVATGKVKEHHKIPATHGIPYTIYPTGSNNFHGAFLDVKSPTIMYCALTKKDSGGGLFPPSIELGSCARNDAMFTGSSPMPVCDNKLYTVGDNIGPGPGSPQQLTEHDIATGKSTNLGDLSAVIPGTYITSVACA